MFRLRYLAISLALIVHQSPAQTQAPRPFQYLVSGFNPAIDLPAPIPTFPSHAFTELLIWSTDPEIVSYEVLATVSGKFVRVHASVPRGSLGATLVFDCGLDQFAVVHIQPMWSPSQR